MQGIPIDRKQLKLDARAAMREHRPSVYVVTLVFLVVTAILEILSTRLQFPGLTLREIFLLNYDEDLMERAIRISMQNQSAAGTFLNFAIDVMNIFLGGGFLLFCLNVSRREEAGFGTLFELFNYFFRFIWLEILTGIFLFLWSLLLVIPGIIAAYRYSMAQFIFFDNPEKGALQCIRESKEMTRGYKGRLFVLDLSFIGWILLSVIPLVSIFTVPYIAVTHANFYRQLKGDQPTETPQSYQTSDPWDS